MSISCDSFEREIHPRTDRSGSHEYRVVVEDNNSSFTVAKEITFNINEKTLNVARVRQEYGRWCWAASLQAILNYMGDTDIRACELVNRARERKWVLIDRLQENGPRVIDRSIAVKKALVEGCDFGLGVGETIFESPTILRTPTMQKMLELKGYSIKLHEGRMSENEIMAQIDSGKPIIALLKTHAIVVRGYRLLIMNHTAATGSCTCI